MNNKLLHKYLSDECTEEEKVKLENWFNGSPQNLQTMHEMKYIWNISPGNKIEVDSYKAWDKFSEQHLRDKATNTESKNYSYSDKVLLKDKYLDSGKIIFCSVAAVAVLIIAFLLSSTYSVQIEDPKPETVSQEITTEKGQRSTIKLSDGSIIILNADSKLKIPGDYLDKDRQLYLEGEAYFEVVPDKDKEFMVHTSESVTRVLGTKFSVSAYPNDEIVQVVVAEGKVSMSSNKKLQAPEVQLKKNQKGTVSKYGKIIASNISDAEKYLDWKDGKISFQNARIKEIEKVLERWFDIEVFFEKSITTYDRLLTGSFDNASLNSILNSIALSLDINYYRDGKKITFKNK